MIWGDIALSCGKKLGVCVCMIVMRGLTSWVSWRTFLVGVVVGYVIARGVHRGVTFRSVNMGWVEESVPYLIPEWSRP